MEVSQKIMSPCFLSEIDEPYKRVSLLEYITSKEQHINVFRSDGRRGNHATGRHVPLRPDPYTGLTIK
jgi:hypothetical protein